MLKLIVAYRNFVNVTKISSKVINILWNKF